MKKIYFHELYSKPHTGVPKFDKREDAILDAINTIKRQSRFTVYIESYIEPGPLWKTLQTEGLIEKTDNGYLWETWDSKTRNFEAVGQIDLKTGRIVKGRGVSLKKKRFYTIGNRFDYNGHFMGSPRETEYTHIKDARKNAYTYVLNEINSKGWPNRGLTCGSMIYGHNVRPNDSYSFEGYVFALRTDVIGILAFKNGSVISNGPIYEVKKDGSLGKILVQTSTLKECEKYQASH